MAGIEPVPHFFSRKTTSLNNATYFVARATSTLKKFKIRINF